MASSTISSELRISLIEDATKQAPKIAAALDKVQKEAAALQKALEGTGASDRLSKNLAKLGASEAHISGATAAWRDYAKAENLAEGGARTKNQIASARAMEDAIVKAVRDVRHEETAAARARHAETVRAEAEAIAAAKHAAHEEIRVAKETAREQDAIARQVSRDARREAQQQAQDQARIRREAAREQRDVSRALAAEQRAETRRVAQLAHEQARTDNTVAGVASFAIAHQAEHLAAEVVHEYRDFDKERRYSKVVLGLTDEQQRPLVDQAFSGGGAQTRYNAAQYLEGQHSLASRGYNKEQVLGLAPVTATLGQAFDLDKLEDGAKLLEGSMLGFRKDVSTEAAARASATRTADLEVKTSKISGSTSEDLINLLARGAQNAATAHLSEEQLFAFGATLKQINIGGDRAATAFSSMTKSLLNPTREARTAIASAGIDYSKYQKVGPINEDGFANTVASNFGVKLSPGVRAGLHKVFSDPEIMNDLGKFTPAIAHVLRRDLHGKDAQSKAKIAGLANSYRNDSVKELDTQGLLKAVHDALTKNPMLANTLFGPKLGGTIAAGLGPMFDHMLEELQNHSQGFAKNVSDEKMAGFNGALNMASAKLSNLGDRIGMAFDSGGSGGFLTHATQNVGAFIDALSNANPAILRVGSEAVLLAGGLAALKGVEFFKGGLGFKASAGALTGSAALLDGSAAALDRAAIALGAAGAIKGVPGVAGAVKVAAGGAALAAEGAAAGAAAGAAGAAGSAAAGAVEGTVAKVGVAAAAAAAGKAALSAGGKAAATRAALAVGGRAAMRAIPGVGEILIGNDLVKGGVDIAANAVGLKKNSDELAEYESKANDPVMHPMMTAEHLWAHLRGRYSREELDIAERRKKAAAAPEAPPLVPKPPLPEEGDEAEDAEEEKKSDKSEAPRRSGFLERHPDFERVDGARATGGPVSRGKTYLVGERGPELFTAGATGQVTNNRLLLQAILSSRDYADRGQRTERNRLALSEVLEHSPDPNRLRHPAAAGRVSTSISTANVQHLLSRSSFASRAAAGDPETAKAIRAMGFELAGAVDGVARAVDRADAHRVTLGGDYQGGNDFYGAEGAGGHPRSFGGGGRRGFMEGGHGSEGSGRKGFAHRAAEGLGGDIPTDGDSVKVATAMLKHREGFQGTAKWDRNHLRLGFGSDTITDPQGGVHEVRAGDHATREDAERDLARRIPEFQRRVAREVGAESWKKLSPVVQGALTSMAYNYGGFSKLPSMRAAIASGDNAKIATAIRLREGDNGGINRERREEEARIIEHGGARSAWPADTAGRVDKVTGGVGDRLASFKRAGVLSNEQCVELARRMVGDTGHVNTWRPGEKADAGHLKPGTPVATFLDARGREVDRYADGTGGRPKRGLDHAAVFEGYERDQAGKITGMKVAEQYKGSGGVHDKVYPFHSGKFGEHDGSNYHAVMRSDGAYLGGRNNPMTDASDDPLALRRSRDAKAAGGADAVHESLSGLHGKTFAPAVDNSHLHETEVALDRIHEKMGTIHATSSRNRQAAAGTARIAGLGSKIRGNYSSPGSGIG